MILPHTMTLEQADLLFGLTMAGDKHAIEQIWAMGREADLRRHSKGRILAKDIGQISQPIQVTSNVPSFRNEATL